VLRSFPGSETEASAAWIDLMSPDQAEKARIEKRYGIRIPVLYMTAPLIAGTTTNHWKLAPTGFILTPDVLVTVHYSDLAPFDAVAGQLRDSADLTPPSVLITLLEDVVDRAADHLEHASEILSRASQALFFEEEARPGLRKETRKIREIIRDMGQASDRASRVRYAFLSIGRMISFVLDRCTPKLDENLRERFESIRHDINSLDEFETSLGGRIQLQQDAATAFINIEQNDVVKVLTVASVVGIPPVMVVGVYGMNFKVMPELDWPLGYPFALALCVLSTVIPYLWFKWRGWI